MTPQIHWEDCLDNQSVLNDLAEAAEQARRELARCEQCLRITAGDPDLDGEEREALFEAADEAREAHAELLAEQLRLQEQLNRDIAHLVSKAIEEFVLVYGERQTDLPGSPSAGL
ncbi:hypothetical protein [Brevibacterium otitidis]|uniref:Uncharacterized protein n=1 Tax=Brevibacterium otitidis TaxID=53364 RepID=A0ABV5X4B5_9MICO|nr:hypothetical protein GCM10023233_33530 [Brevibacterium otitidis]